MVDEKKERGFLSDLFWKAAKIATIGVVAAVAWQVLLDPIFFPVFHDPSNMTAQAFVAFMRDSFSWIPDIIGLSGQGGLLKTQFANSILAPYYASLAPPAAAAMTEAFSGGLSLDDVPAR